MTAPSRAPKLELIENEHTSFNLHAHAVNLMRELDYLVTADDIAYLNHYHTQNSPMLRRNRAAVGTMMTLIGAGGFLLAMGTAGLSMGIMMLVVILGVWLAVGRRRSPSRQQTEYIRRLFEEGKNRALFGHHHIRLLDDRLEVSTEFSRGEVKWEGVERVEEDEGYIFIYVSALNAYVINKKFFPSEQHARAFFGAANNLHRRAAQLEAGELPLDRLLPSPTNRPAPKPSHTPPRRLAAAGPGTDGSVR